MEKDPTKITLNPTNQSKVKKRTDKDNAKKPFYWRKKKTKKDYQEDLLVSLFSLVIFIGIIGFGGYTLYLKVLEYLN